MNVEVLVEGSATIGESPTWSPADGSIYWIDVKEPALHRVGGDGRVRRWELDSDVGAFALTEHPDNVVVALRNGVFDLNLETGETDLLTWQNMPNRMVRLALVEAMMAEGERHGFQSERMAEAGLAAVSRI